MTLKQIIKNCERDPRKKIIFDRLNALAQTEIQEERKKNIGIGLTLSHVKIVCKAVFSK